MKIIINIKNETAMVVSKKTNSPKVNIAIGGLHNNIITSYYGVTCSISWNKSLCMYIGSLIPDDGRSERGDQKKKNYSTDHNTSTHLDTYHRANLRTRLRAIKCYV